MGEQVWWYLTRSSGIVATVLGVLALGLGFIFSARDTGSRLKPAWWLDLHNWLGGLALAFTGFHVLAAYMDEFSGIGAVQVLVPGTAAGERIGMGIGVIAVYLLALVVFTSWPKRRLKRRTWRIVHLSSILAVVLGGLHGLATGSDAENLLFRLLIVALAGMVLYPAAVRGIDAARRSCFLPRKPVGWGHGRPQRPLRKLRYPQSTAAGDHRQAAVRQVSGDAALAGRRGHGEL